MDVKSHRETELIVSNIDRNKIEVKFLEEKHKLEVDKLRLENKKLKNDWWKSPLISTVTFVLGLIASLVMQWLWKKLGI